MRERPRKHRLPILVLCALASLVAPARAADHGLVLAPEANAFVKLTDQTRLFLLGDLTHNVTKSLTDGEVGAHLDYTLKPRLRPWLQDANWERDRYLWVRVGYLWVHSVGSRDEPSSERRIILQMTQRIEPYLSRQDDSRSASANVNTIGFVLKHFR